MNKLDKYFNVTIIISTTSNTVKLNGGHQKPDNQTFNLFKTNSNWNSLKKYIYLFIHLNTTHKLSFTSPKTFRQMSLSDQLEVQLEWEKFNCKISDFQNFPILYQCASRQVNVLGSIPGPKYVHDGFCQAILLLKITIKD